MQGDISMIHSPALWINSFGQSGKRHHKSCSNVELQSRPLMLEQPLQRTAVRADMCDIECPTSPVLASFIVLATVEIDCVVEGARSDPLEFFWRVRLFGLFERELVGRRVKQPCSEGRSKEGVVYLSCFLSMSANLIDELRCCVWTVG